MALSGLLAACLLAYANTANWAKSSNLSNTTDNTNPERCAQPLQPSQMRIGIHSGPVMAGIVGMRVPRYSLFGNTTTLANQLETHGVGGKIHVSDFTLK